MVERADIVIVGGGVIGLSIAYVLSGEGIGCAVLDAGELGRAASWAGAGMIAPPARTPASDPWSALWSMSLELHPVWSVALRDQTGIDNGYRVCGGIDVALRESDLPDQEIRRAAWVELGIEHEPLDPPAARRCEPLLTHDWCAAYYFPTRAQLRNPRHLRALVLACERRGASLLPGCPVVSFDVDSGRVRGVRTPRGELACGAAIVTAGPWSESLLNPLHIEVPTPPVRGQMVLLRTLTPSLQRIVEWRERYLVPREDGHVLVGSTQEDAGFDATTTPEAIASLRDDAFRLCPALAAAEQVRAWAGLRPGSRDQRPYLARVPAFDNLFLAAGHKRVGLQLSTGTAVVMADLVLGRTPRVELAPFAVDRPAEEPFLADPFHS